MLAISLTFTLAVTGTPCIESGLSAARPSQPPQAPSSSTANEVSIGQDRPPLHDSGLRWPQLLHRALTDREQTACFLRAILGLRRDDFLDGARLH